MYLNSEMCVNNTTLPKFSHYSYKRDDYASLTPNKTVTIYVCRLVDIPI